MSKFLSIVTLAIALVSFNANAATLDWFKTPPKGFANGSGTHTLEGGYTNNLPVGKLGGKWKFTVSDDATVSVNVTELSDQLLDLVVTLDHVALNFANGEWSFMGALKPGVHFLYVKGRTTAAGGNIDIDINTVPVPAALWLFASAIIPFLGFSRRKAG